MHPLAIIIVLSILIGAVLVFSPLSVRDMIASFPLFQAVVQTQGEAGVEEPRANIFRSIESGRVWFPQVAVDAGQNIPEVTVLDLAMDILDPNIVYAGTEGAGLYKSVNNGQNWDKLFDRNKVLAANATVYRMAQDPNNAENIYIAAFQNKYGVFLKSTDGGLSFAQTYISQLENYPLRALAIHPVLGNILYIGTAQGGVFVSRDYGETWEVLKWLTGKISDIVINPENPSEMYVVTSDRGLFRSVDGGQTWDSLARQLSRVTASNNIIAFRMDPADSRVLYLAVANGLVVSENRGTTWRFVDLLIPPRQLPVDAIALSPQNRNTIYVGVGALLYISEDAGVNWSVQKFNTQKRINIITVDYRDEQNIFMGMKNPQRQSSL
ncbi:MAG: YCF48-related protein [Patescibacteria group bacterium]